MPWVREWGYSIKLTEMAKGKPLTATMWNKKHGKGADSGSEAHAELEVFTDGSGGDGSTAAGWGFVGVRNEAEVHAARTALAYRIIITIVCWLTSWKRRARRPRRRIAD